MKNEKISQARKLYWATISKEKKTEMFRNLALLKHSKETLIQKRLASKIMYAGKLTKERLLFGNEKLLARLKKKENRKRRIRRKITKEFKETFGVERLVFKR